MIEFLILFPVVMAAFLLGFRNRMLNRIVMAVYVTGALAGAGLLIGGRKDLLAFVPMFRNFFAADGLGVFFFAIMALVLAGSALYSHRFLYRTADNRWDSIYTLFVLLFAGSMSGVLFSAHMGVFWVFIEMTTLTSAMLIYYERTRASLEATWKYIFVCSIGIALAFVGIIMMTIGANGTESLYLDQAGKNVDKLSPFWLRMSFVFLLTGYGTKVGLAPMHSWKPDAYSEAPSPVSALLAGALANAALLGIIRAMTFMYASGLGDYAQKLLLFMGVFSIAVASVFMLRAHNFKRLLAYSSVEHMGMIVIGIALGGAALFASMLHILAHSLSKSALFLAATNVERMYGTKETGGIRGIVFSDRFTGGILFAGIVALTATPPFATFVSEFMIVKNMFSGGRWAPAVVVLLFLTIALYGLLRPFFGMLFGKDESRSVVRFSATDHLLPMVFLAAVLLLGLYIPSPVREILEHAAAVIYR